MMHVVICDDEPCFQEAVVNAVKNGCVRPGIPISVAPYFLRLKISLSDGQMVFRLTCFFWISKFRTKSAAWHWLKKFATPVIIFPLCSLQIT